MLVKRKIINIIFLLIEKNFFLFLKNVLPQNYYLSNIKKIDFYTFYVYKNNWGKVSIGVSKSVT